MSKRIKCQVEGFDDGASLPTNHAIGSSIFLSVFESYSYFVLCIYITILCSSRILFN